MPQAATMSSAHPNKTRQPAQLPRRSMTQRVMALPRLARTVIVFAGVLVMAFAMTNVVGELYARAFSTTIFNQAIYWIVAIICLGMYMAGYVFIIGIPGVPPPAGRAQSIYLLAVFVLAGLSIIWMVMRAASALPE